MSADEGLQIGRRKKAKRIAEKLREIGCTPDDARNMSEGDWNSAAMLVSYSLKIPSAETRALVIAELESDPKDEDVPA